MKSSVRVCGWKTIKTWYQIRLFDGPAVCFPADICGVKDRASCAGRKPITRAHFVIPLEAFRRLRYELRHDDACGTEQLVVGSLLGGLDHACALEINKPPGTSRSGGFFV